LSEIKVAILSFGYKYGIPINADFVFDVRCLPNPFWVASMREMSGFDREVRDFVFADSSADGYYNSILLTVKSYLDLTGKDTVTVCIGCTGGQHRSVAAAIRLFDDLSKVANCSIAHRESFRFIKEGIVK